MELLFVVLIAAGFGFIAHYTLPGRDARGAMLLGSLAAAVAAAIWVALLWLGFTFDGGWIWVISLVAAGASALAAGIILPPRRRAHDRAMLTRLSGGKA